MNYRFHPEAQAELNDAFDHYEECKDGLGGEFTREVYAALEHICRFPDAWTALSRNTRRCLVKRFPYGIVYQTKGDEITIIAVMQLNRKPDYWTKRKDRP